MGLSNYTIFPELNDRILAIWSKNRAAHQGKLTLPPMFSKPLHRGGLLMVGMNPSFAKSELMAFRQMFGSVDFSNAEICRKERYRLCEFQAWQYLTNRFFKERTRMVNEILPEAIPLIQHYDLFPFRMTIQKQFMAVVKSDVSLVNDCVLLFEEVVQRVRPWILWIANKGAWGFLAGRDGWGGERVIPGHKPRFRSFVIEGQQGWANSLIVTNQIHDFRQKPRADHLREVLMQASSRNSSGHGHTYDKK